VVRTELADEGVQEPLKPEANASAPRRPACFVCDAEAGAEQVVVEVERARSDGAAATDRQPKLVLELHHSL
jgi:hypothetical protein